MAKILYAKDDEPCGILIPRRLQRKGFECVMTVDGGEAVELAHSEQPDLILISTALLVKDAWTVIKEIKAAEDTQNIPIIALIADNASEKEQALAAGCDEYEYDTRHIDIPSLLEKINQLLSNSVND